jgi:hypothetical protein
MLEGLAGNSIGALCPKAILEASKGSAAKNVLMDNPCARQSIGGAV